MVAHYLRALRTSAWRLQAGAELHVNLRALQAATIVMSADRCAMRSNICGRCGLAQLNSNVIAEM